MEIYKEKNNSYFSYIREDLIEFIPQNPKNKVLEIGAGTGATLLEIKKRGLAEEIVGIELMPIKDSTQNDKNIDKFIIGNIENLDLDFKESYFDVILLGDVLEHLLNPWETIKKLSKYLRKNGVFITSLPNLRSLPILKSILLKGDFKYTDAGILDKTHLRFFCKKNMIDLFEQNNLKVDTIISSTNIYKHKSKKKLINKLTQNLFDEFFSIKYFIVAKKL